MAQELRVEELRHAVNRHIASFISPDEQCRITNDAICREFQDYFEKLFTRELGLSSAQFDTYFADFHRLTATETARYERRIMEKEVWQALIAVGTDKTPGIDGRPCSCPCTIYNNWMRQGTIPQRFTRAIKKLLRKNKHGGDGISNFHPLMMLNTDIKILVKILADRLQIALSSLICPEQPCAVKSSIILDSLHMARTITEKNQRKCRPDEFRSVQGL